MFLAVQQGSLSLFIPNFCVVQAYLEYWIINRGLLVNLKNVIGMLLVPLLLLGCASNENRQPEVKEIFVTDIKENGTKLFSYSVTMNSPQKERDGRGMGRKMPKGEGGMRGGKQGRKGAGKPNRESMMSRVKEMINEKLDSKLEETGYCRESYIELDSFIGKGQSQIRGKCKEYATYSDRIKFTNGKNT